VALVRFSRLAEKDLLGIARYTLRTWGRAQALRYLDDLQTCCGMLAQKPALGRRCDNFRPELRRLERGRHVIFYRSVRGGILVSRILHARMLPERHEHDD